MYQTPTVQKLGLIEPRKPPADSLVAPYNSTALPGGHNLIDQSDVYTLAAVSCKDGYHFSTSSVNIAYRVLCKEGGWWLLSTCTGN